ncbi:MAG TPA: sodium/proton-translocating pyrophosphatase, partial [Ktedonobacterales bacterium]|nr:sodium/proton-translocating pyrophosphatase [Ktedonobacterales bacterium]
QPDYGRCVRIVTGAALKEMVLPGLLVVVMPLCIGLIFRHFGSEFNTTMIMDAPMLHGVAMNLSGAEAVAALLMVGTITGIMMAMLMNNGGGAWDNAKKYIEAGYLKDEHGNVLGKGTPAHEASVVGDTVGDPFKDTAGPSLHIVIKLLATITLVLAPLFIALHPL